ncbi:MAG: hypothetical protein ACE5HN_07595 [Nitrospiria bacterium]
MKTLRRFPRMLRIIISIFFLAAVFACASVPVRNPSALSGVGGGGGQIRISNAPIGASIEISPQRLKIAPGGRVVWINQTTYDVQINFDPDQTIAGKPSIIPRHSAVRGRFDQIGTFRYTLIFSSSKTFGRVRGTIVVEDPELHRKPPPSQPKEKRAPEGPPDGMPEII